MCSFFQWERDGKERQHVREQLKIAMTREFNSIYGKDEEDLGAWQNLCRVLGIVPVPQELGDCRKVRSQY